MASVERRRWIKVAEYRRPNGRSTILLRCPFCGLDVIAYIWSLCGSGKRCDCGALHTSGDSQRLEV